jgi:hypothetical protein
LCPNRQTKIVGLEVQIMSSPLVDVARLHRYVDESNWTFPYQECECPIMSVHGVRRAETPRKKGEWVRLVLKHMTTKERALKFVLLK